MPPQSHPTPHFLQQPHLSSSPYGPVPYGFMPPPPGRGQWPNHPYPLQRVFIPFPPNHSHLTTRSPVSVPPRSNPATGHPVNAAVSSLSPPQAPPTPPCPALSVSPAVPADHSEQDSSMLNEPTDALQQPVLHSSTPSDTVIQALDPPQPATNSDILMSVSVTRKCTVTQIPTRRRNASAASIPPLTKLMSTRVMNTDRRSFIDQMLQLHELATTYEARVEGPPFRVSTVQMMKQAVEILKDDDWVSLRIRINNARIKPRTLYVEFDVAAWASFLTAAAKLQPSLVANPTAAATPTPLISGILSSSGDDILANLLARARTIFACTSHGQSFCWRNAVSPDSRHYPMTAVQLKLLCTRAVMKGTSIETEDKEFLDGLSLSPDGSSSRGRKRSQQVASAAGTPTVIVNLRRSRSRSRSPSSSRRRYEDQQSSPPDSPGLEHMFTAFKSRPENTNRVSQGELDDALQALKDGHYIPSSFYSLTTTEVSEITKLVPGVASSLKTFAEKYDDKMERKLKKRRRG